MLVTSCRSLVFYATSGKIKSFTWERQWPSPKKKPAEKSQHEKIVSLVAQMLELHKSKAGAKTQAEIDVYERQIHAVDEQIDSLVYELYGLTGEEIKIVENK